MTTKIRGSILLACVGIFSAISACGKSHFESFSETKSVANKKNIIGLISLGNNAYRFAVCQRIANEDKILEKDLNDCTNPFRDIVSGKPFNFYVLPADKAYENMDHSINVKTGIIVAGTVAAAAVPVIITQRLWAYPAAWSQSGKIVTVSLSQGGVAATQGFQANIGKQLLGDVSKVALAGVGAGSTVSVTMAVIDFLNKKIGGDVDYDVRDSVKDLLNKPKDNANFTQIRYTMDTDTKAYVTRLADAMECKTMGCEISI